MAFNKSMVGVLTVELFLNGDSLGFLNLNLESERVGHTLDDEGEYFLEYFSGAQCAKLSFGISIPNKLRNAL